MYLLLTFEPIEYSSLEREAFISGNYGEIASFKQHNKIYESNDSQLFLEDENRFEETI